MRNEFFIELVRKDKYNNNIYSLINKGNWNFKRAENEFYKAKQYFPEQRIEVWSTDWVNTKFGYAPMIRTTYPIKQR